MPRGIKHLGVRGLALGTALLIIALTLPQGRFWSAGSAGAATYTIDTDLTIPATVTGAQIDAALRAIRPDSGLIGLGNAFVRVSNEQGVNAVYITAHAAWESAWGTSRIAREKNNLFGYKARDACPYTCAASFATMTESIETVVPYIKQNYLTPGGQYYHGSTLRGMNVRYATDPNWGSGIARVMNLLVSTMGTGGPVAATPTATAPQLTAAPRVGIEAGHGDGDPGSSSCDGRIREATITLGVAQRAAEILRERGYRVDIFRGDAPGGLPKSQMRGYQADAFVALHTDFCAGNNSGYKTSRYGGVPVTGKDGSGDQSDRLVDAIWSAYGVATGLPKDRGAGHFTPNMLYYWGVNPARGIHASTPGAIIEMGWLSGDAAFMTSAEGQQKMGRGVASAIHQLVGYEGNPAPAPTPPAPELRGPLGGELLGSLTAALEWQNPAGTRWFHVQLAPHNNDGPGLDMIIGDATLVQQARYVVPSPRLGEGNYLLLPGMNYTWRVRTSPAVGPLAPTDPSWSPWSVGGFRTATPSSGSITLTAPAGGASAGSLTPNLTWINSNDQIFYYEVQVSQDPAFVTDPATATAPVYWELVHGGLTVPLNSYTVRAEYPLEPGMTYFWRVRPRVQGDGTPVDWTPALSFRTPAP